MISLKRIIESYNKIGSPETITCKNHFLQASNAQEALHKLLQWHRDSKEAR
jgi:hypothetical protein